MRWRQRAHFSTRNNVSLVRSSSPTAKYLTRHINTQIQNQVPKSSERLTINPNFNITSFPNSSLTSTHISENADPTVFRTSKLIRNIQNWTRKILIKHQDLLGMGQRDCESATVVYRQKDKLDTDSTPYSNHEAP